MLKINRTPPAEMRAKNRVKQFLPPPPEVINVENALALGRQLPLLWDNIEYRVKVVSWRDGLELQRAAIAIDRLKAETPTTEEQLEDAEADFIQTVALFHSLLDPRPEQNPFSNATLPEVGALLGFFCGCQMIQRESSRLAKPLHSTRSTRSPSSREHSPAGWKTGNPGPGGIS